jgi:flotillin
VRLQAEADAAAILARAEAEAKGLQAKGLAEAEALRARGLAEAEARQRQVEALNVQSQAAIVDTALKVLPEMTRHLSEAYGRIGNVTYVASGQGDGVTSRVSQEVAGMVPLLGALFESTTGLKLRDLIASQQATSAAPRNDSTPPQPSEVVVATAHVDGQP